MERTPEQNENINRDRKAKNEQKKSTSILSQDETKFNQVYFARVPVQDNTRIITSKQGLQHVNEAFAGQYEFLGGTI